MTFRDYLAAERQLRSGPRYERDRQYWLGRIDELPPRPDLPMAETTGSAGQARFRRYALMLEPEQWSALRDRARAKGMTPSTAVLAAYAEVIGKWCRRPDFTLNLTLLNRQPLHADVPRIIGDFTSVDLLGVWQNRATSFADRAAALQDQVWRDLDHRLFSGVEVMREIARRNDSDAALMPIVFTSAIGVGGTDDGLGENQWGRLGYGISQTPQVFIDCQNIERSGGLSTNWDVREGVLPESVVADMFAAYRQLLTRMCTEDEVWTKRFPVDLPEHQRVRRHSVNDTAAPMPDALLHDGFIAQAERASHRTAILSARGELTYGELLDRARGVAAALREAGCQRGDVVGVVMDKGWEQVAAVLGIHLGGAAYVPVDTAQPEVRRERMLGDAGVRLVLTQTWLHDELGLPEGITSIVVDEHGWSLRSAGRAGRARRPGVCHLHVGLDRPAQGRHDHPPQRGQHDQRHQHQIRRDRRRPGADAGQSRLRPVGLRHLRHLGPRRGAGDPRARSTIRSLALGGAGRRARGDGVEFRTSADADAPAVSGRRTAPAARRPARLAAPGAALR